nr:hypothetical protein CFP56_58966 [Quercus suber]
MVESFCSKYFHGEEKVTIFTLHNTKQKSFEGLLDFIRRFRDAALDYYGQFKEQEMVEICIDTISVKPFTAEKPKSEKKDAPQALTVSTNEPMVGEKRKRGEEEEYPPIPCTDEEMNAVIDKWMVDGVLRPFKPI